MVFVDVDHILSLIHMSERDRPVRSNRLVIVDCALVVTVVQSSWPDKRIDFAFVQPIDDGLNNNSNVVALRFLKKRDDRPIPLFGRRSLIACWC